MHMEHYQESEKMNPVHMTQGTITLVTDQSSVSECPRSSDHHIPSIEGLKMVSRSEPQICHGGSQKVVDSYRTCCQDRAMSGVDHIEDKATQTPKDYVWLTELEVNQERDCLRDSTAEKQSDPTLDSQLGSIAFEKQTQSTGSQNLPSGSRNDVITALKGGESTTSEMPMIQDEVNKDTESLKEESEVFTESAVDSIPEVMGSWEASKGIDNISSMLSEVDSTDKSHRSCNSEDNVYKEDNFSLSEKRRKSFSADEKTDEASWKMIEKHQVEDSRNGCNKEDNSCPYDWESSKSPSGEKDEDDWEVFGKDQPLTKAQRGVVNNKKEKSCVSDEKRSSSPYDEKSDEGKCEVVQKDRPAQSEGDVCKEDNSCPFDRKGGKNPSGDEDDWEVLGKDQMLREAQRDVNKKEKSCLSDLSDEKRSSSPYDEKSDEGNCEMVIKDQPAQSEGDLCKEDNSCPSDRKGGKKPSGEEDEDDWEVIGKSQVFREAQGDVNKKEKSCLSDKKRSSSPHDEKSDEGYCEMVVKDQPAQSEGDLCKEDNSCPSDRKGGKKPSGEEDEGDWEVIGKDQMLREAQRDVNKKEKSCLSDEKRSSSPCDEKSDEGNCEMVVKDQPAQSEGDLCKEDNSCRSDRKGSKNPSGEEDEDDWEVLGKDQMLREAQRDVNKKEKSCLSERERSSSPHDAKSDEDNCKLVEKDQQALSEDEDDWEMVYKRQLPDIQDDVFKKWKSCLPVGKRSSSPLHGETDEDRCELMEQDQEEMMEKNKLEEPQGDLYKEDNSCLSEEKENYCPLDDTDNFVQVKKPDGFPEYSEFGQDSTSLADETGYFSEIDQGQHGNNLKVPPSPLKDEVDQFCGKDGNVLMWRECEKQDPPEASTSSGARPKERFPHPPGKIAPVPCSEYSAQNYWQQIIHQEECVRRATEDGGYPETESRTEGGRLLTFCTESP
ncbi:hypothetical protein HOLleu_34812 [Holothuria leucospilota]|uniref:Uncharacterized protein n=1 Tax=Holothuria leucospilota TaxID=206669 RepID=A0A9Q1BHD8_HOLLE|nr:hypothetical protein HOLleu_34812 [Holothuria leucospilota]